MLNRSVIYPWVACSTPRIRTSRILSRVSWSHRCQLSNRNTLRGTKPISIRSHSSHTPTVSLRDFNCVLWYRALLLGVWSVVVDPLSKRVNRGCFLPIGTCTLSERDLACNLNDVILGNFRVLWDAISWSEELIETGVHIAEYRKVIF